MSDRRALERALQDVERRLRAQPASLAFKFERAQVLDRLGRTNDARLGYVEILQRDSSHFGALNDLGRLLFAAGMRKDALTCFTAAVAKHPRNPIGHANLAFMLLRAGDAQRAREHYEIALQLDPKNAETHRGLALALEAIGEHAGAQRHADAGFGSQPVVELPYRGDGRPIRVLLIVSASAGNVPAERFLDDRIFATSKLVAEYYDASIPLPPHDVIFNAVGDADICLPALHSVQALLEHIDSPVINAPATVLVTGRAQNAMRFNDLAGVRAPQIVAFTRTALLEVDAAGELACRGFRFPLLVRAPGFHAGLHFERVERAEMLAETVARIPGDSLLAIEFLDARSPDGNVRKYRAMIVGPALYPLHLAIASQWKVHYFSSDMADRAEHRVEEEAFLNDMPAVLGAPAMAALETVREHLSLDYAGIDFSFDTQGRLVVFEANATMALPHLESEARSDARRGAIVRIETAVRAMLNERAGRPSPA